MVASLAPLAGYAASVVEPPKQEASASDYTLGYGLSILGVGLGLLFLLKPSKRQNFESNQGYVSKLDD
jgi:hypothetical protein